MAQVIGLTPGILSLYLLAVERFRVRLDRAGAQTGIPRSYQRLVGRLSFQQLILRNSLAKMFSEAGISHGQLRELLDDPAGPVWKHVVLGSRLQDYLGEEHQQFLVILSSFMLDIFKLLASNLFMDTGTKYRKRLKVVVRQSKYRNAVDPVDVVNGLISRGQHLDSVLKNVRITRDYIRRAWDAESVATAVGTSLSDSGVNDADV